jgi:mRNA interferase HigB
LRNSLCDVWAVNGLWLLPDWDLDTKDPTGTPVRVIAKRTLREFWEAKRERVDAEGPLLAWHSEVSQVHWRSPADIKAQYRNASFVGDNRVIFNIAGNKYRLIVRVNYRREILYVRFVGTHADYDRINAETI